MPTLTDRGLATVVRGPDQHGHPAAAGGRHCADYSEYAYFYERAFTTTHNVRSLLAHVPTFLIFDGHELTDDWNFDGYVQDTVLQLHIGAWVANDPGLPAWNPGDEFEAARLEVGELVG